MRALLRRLILWALGGGPQPVHDAAALDRIAAESRKPAG
jgi:hypothetical protein